jgi:hypothetical protein
MTQPSHTIRGIARHANDDCATKRRLKWLPQGRAVALVWHKRRGANSETLAGGVAA